MSGVAEKSHTADAGDHAATEPMENELMTKTITGIYDVADQVRNAREDLIATGIEQEKLFADYENKALKVMVPAEVEAEILEIIERHNPSRVTTD